MGLDMTLYAEKTAKRVFNNGIKPPPSLEGTWPELSRTFEVHYWRKHPDLHGFIVQNFSPSGVDDCQPIYLDVTALAKIARAILRDELPKTTGFFFGDSEYHKDDKEENARVFLAAAEWLNSGPDDAEYYREICYQASW